MLIHSLPYPSLIRCTSPNWKLSSSSLKCTYFIRLSTLSLLLTSRSLDLNLMLPFSMEHAHGCKHSSPLILQLKNFKLTNFSLFFFTPHLAVPPLVNLALGSTLSNDDIKEGDDVYFECHVQANPKFTKLSWLHNVSGFTRILFTFHILI